jgi:prepilin-type N-terminal cleavage/methylation domain-containing protein
LEQGLPSQGFVRHHPSSQAGFTLLEVLLVSSLVVIMSGTAVSLIGSWVPIARADAAMRQVTYNLTSAREMAISQTRNIIVQVANNRITLLRDEPGPNTTLLRIVPLEYDMVFKTYSGMPDTPDQFGNNGTGVDFGTAISIRFTSDGSLIDQLGVPVNGTIFMGHLNNQQTARAVTIFGGTGRVRGFRWTGSRWEQ